MSAVKQLLAYPKRDNGHSFRVLIGDRCRLLLELLQAALTTRGYSVVGTVDNGRRAVELARKRHPRVVLLGISMPVMGGVEAARDILQVVPHTSVLLLAEQSEQEVLGEPGGVGLGFTYDGSLPTSVTWSGPVAGSVGVTYNNDFRVTTQTVNGANSVSFAYDNDGLLMTAGALGLKRHAQHGLVERDSLGAALAVWGYDPKGALASYTTSYSGSTLFQTSYVRDSVSRITQLTETIQGVTSVAVFAYDSAGRLKTVTRGGQLTARYRYDLNGNRLDVNDCP